MVVLGGFKGVLDLIFAIASVAYGLRRLSRFWTGAAIRVERSSDNAQLDIGFIGEDLDYITLLAFVGTGSGFVVIWYDQSGNGRDATQTTPALQPRIVSNGAIETKNGRPTIRQLTGGGGFVASVPITSSTLTANAVASLDQQGGAQYKGLMSISNAGQTDYDGVSRGALLIQDDLTTNLFGVRNSNTSSAAGITIGTQFVATSVYDGTNNILWKDGSAGSTVASAGNFSTTLLSIGQRFAWPSPWVGTFSEAILFASVFSTTDRQTLERNQGGYYSITVA
jgi:hypothetical protein